MARAVRCSNLFYLSTRSTRPVLSQSNRLKNNHLHADFGQQHKPYFTSADRCGPGQRGVIAQTAVEDATKFAAVAHGAFWHRTSVRDISCQGSYWGQRWGNRPAACG